MSADGNRVETYCQGWISSLALLLSQLTAGDWQIAAAAAPPEYVPAAGLQITVEGGVEGRQWLSIAAADLEVLLGIFLGEDVKIPGELDEAQKQALEELGRQWAGLAASALGPEFGEVRLQVALAEARSPANGLSRFLCAADEGRSIAARLEWDEALAASLGSGQADADAATAAVSHADAPAGASSVCASAQVADLLRRGNLDLLMDVELAVMLRFGSRQATLREVLDLAAGAVLELDREIQEPVDLVLNDKVIARGEVVVVDGNYGLRVLEVASPQQRVNSL